MNLQELKKTPHLSASSIGDYIDCGLLYKLGRIDKFQPDHQAEALVFGTVIHRVLESYYRNRQNGITLSIKEIHELYEKHWRENAEGNENIQYSEGKDFDTLLLEGKELLTAYHYNNLNDNGFKVAGIEEAFSFTLDGCPVPIIGAMDLVEEDESGTIIIVDFKTAGRSYSIDEVDRNFQLTLYQMAAKKNGYDGREILLRFDCLIKTKTKKFEQYYTTRNEIDERRAQKKITAVWKGISNGVFIPNDAASNWKCKGCSYKKFCDEYLER